MNSRVLTFLLLCCISFTASSQLIITGAYDGPLPGGDPKGVELYATQAIPDLSIYGIGSANNGGGTDGEEFTFPADAIAEGEFIYVSNETNDFTSFFGFAPDYTTGAMAINGDDAIELFMNGSVIDVFGDIGTDGTGQAWDYLDGWAYRADGTGPDGSTWTLGNWMFSGINALDGQSSNSTSPTPFPLGSYQAATAQLLITGVYDGPLPGGDPKGVELFATQAIPDLSIYGLGSANNGGGTDGEEFTFPSVAVAEGDFIYVSNETNDFTAFFGFAPDYTTGAMAINGDDAIELFMNGSVIDVFGDIDTDGTGQPWDYLDGWAYRVDGTGPDGSTWAVANWTYSGTNVFDGQSTNASSPNPFPVGSYQGVFTPVLIDVTFEVNMQNQNVAADGVFLAGNFNGFAGTPMNDIGSDLWSVTLSLDANTDYQFVFENGLGNVEPGMNLVSCGVADGNGGINRTITTGASPSTYGPVCFASCSDCSCDVSFAYPDAQVCVGSGSISVINTSEIGEFSVMGTGNLALNAFTGEVDVDNSDPGMYTITNIVNDMGASPALIITGAIDGPLSGGTPKGVELYALTDIADLSLYGLGSANNGGGTDGQEFTFPAVSVTAGTYIYVASESTQFMTWFGFAPDYTTGAMGINGDDAVELFFNGAVLDVFGDINTDGTGTAWDHLDGWAYRASDACPTPIFSVADWTFSGTNALDGETTNATAMTPFPTGTYTSSGCQGGTACMESFDFELTILPAPSVDAGFPLSICIGDDAPLQASGTGTWSGGSGSFNDNTDPQAVYTPDVSEINSTVILKWTVDDAICGPVTDSTSIVIFSNEADAGFEYDAEVYCPNGADPVVILTTGVRGQFSVTGGDPASIDLDPATGDINLSNTELGTYEITNSVLGCGSLMITGVIDGPLSGGTPKAVELFAFDDVPDLSIYSIGSANNGGGTDGEELMLSGSLQAGEYYYASTNEVSFFNFFGFLPDTTGNGLSINGDDAIELFCNGRVIDLFGDINIDGTGTPWDHLDGWVYRVNDSNPSGASFDFESWTYSGTNALDGETVNASAATPFPIGTFSTTASNPCPPVTASFAITVGDLEPLEVSCPGDISVTLTDGACGEYVNYPLPIVFDNCPGDFEYGVVSGPLTGDFLTPEESPYTVVLFAVNSETRDSGTCEFMIEINGVVDPVQSLTCNSRLNVSIDENCEAVIDADMILEGGNYGCYNDYVMIIGTDTMEGSITLTELGEYTVMVYDSLSNNTCWATILVEDKFAPVFTCEDITVSCIEYTNGQLPTLPIVLTDEETMNTTGFPAGGIFLDAPATINFDLSSMIPAFSAITDVNVQIQMTDVAGFDDIDDFDMFLTAPDGTTGQIIDDGFGCFGQIGGLDFTLDADEPDYGPCSDLISGGNHNIIDFNTVSLDIFDGGMASGMWSVRMVNVFGTDEYQVDNVVIEVSYRSPITDLNDLDNCGITGLEFADVLVSSDECAGQQIMRTYVVTDNAGNTASCTNMISVVPIGVNDIGLPPALIELSCGGGTTPEAIAAFFDDPLTEDDLTSAGVIENNEGISSAYPFYQAVGADGGLHDQPLVGAGICGLLATYNDLDIDACGAGCFGNKKIIREWTILDWCAETTTNYTQIIKAVDGEGPTFATKDTVVSTRPWDCTAQFEVPGPWELHDACDDSPIWYVTGPSGVSITGNMVDGYIVSGAPKGDHVFTYFAEDCCGNITAQTAMITVRDGVAPVAATKQDIVIALTPAGPGFVSSAKIFVPQVDNFSYDACTDVYIEVRRPSGAPACDNVGVNGYNNNVTFNNAVPTLHSDDNRDDTDNGQFVKVCCEDVRSATVDVNGDGVVDTGYIEVVMRVWDDANMSGVYGDVDQTGHADNYNESWTFVKVEDNLPPTIACPADVTIECYWAIDLSTDFGPGFQSVDQATFDKTGMATAFSTCDVENVEFSDRVSLDDCGIGTITRTFRASKEDKNGNAVTSQCRQIITVNDDYQSTFMVSPPNPRVTPVASCGIEQSDLDKNKPTPVGGICDVIGESVTIDTFLFEGGVCKKWVAEYNYTNWCTGESMGPFFAEFIYEDTGVPTIECQDTCLSVDANCSYFYSFDKSAIDTSGCTQDGWLKWLVTFDAWADGNIDYAVSSYAPSNYTTWRVDEALSEQYGLPLTTLWIYTEGTASGAAFTGNNGPITIPEDLGGQMSNHKITYKVTDGCHNFASCTEDVMIADKKAPTPYCVSLSSALMAPNAQGIEMVELWACDFNVGSFDNCTAQDQLYYTFDEIPFVVDTLIPVGNVFLPVNATVAHFFDENGFVDFNGDGGLYPEVKDATILRYERGEIQQWLPESNCSGKAFTQNDAPQAIVIMSVWDQKLNTDFCEVFLNLRSSNDPGSTRSILGQVRTPMGSGVESVEMTIDPEGFEKKIVMTDAAGNYSVGVDVLKSAVISAASDGDDDNGVSTLDLVLIQRHILSLAPFASPYQVIAADVNASESITGADVVELRKLILGVSSEFSATDSWNFVDATQTMTPDNAFPYRDRMTVAASDQDQLMDMVAVKMGDVNYSAETLEGRSSKVAHLVYDNVALSAGQTVEVAVSSSDYTDAYGYQFTLDVSGIEIVDIIGSELSINGSNMAVLDDNTVTVSYASAEMETATDLFTLVVRATEAGMLSDKLSMSSTVTRAEAYTGVGSSVAVMQIDLSPRAGLDYALAQNEPNPFKSQTVIGFTMAEAGSATLTVYDVAGRVIKRVTGDYVQGANAITLDRTDLTASGVLYYTLDAGDFSETKRMILID